MQIFYDTSLQKQKLEIGSIIQLNPELSHHIIVVLRKTENAEIALADGNGKLYLSEIITPNKKNCQIKITEIDKEFGRQCSQMITMAFVPTKSMDRVEWAVEKAVEIGVRRIVPILSSRSERKSVNIERLQRIAKSAAEQSLKGFLPEVTEMQKFDDFVKQNPGGLIAHCNDGNKITIPSGQEEYIVMIGPEGDFSPQEVTLALENSYKEITLGNSRLRAETAVVCAAFTCTL